MRRIITLLPAATEIVVAAGFGQHLVGVSHECDFPNFVTRLPTLTQSNLPSGLSSEAIDAEVRRRVAVGEGLYSVDSELLASLEPDLIVTQGLCDVCAINEADVRRVAEGLPKVPQVLSLNPTSVQEVLDGIELVGKAAGDCATAKKALESLAARIETVRNAAQPLIAQGRQPRVLMLEWLAPPFSAGHWNPQLIEWAGGTAVGLEASADHPQSPSSTSEGHAGGRSKALCWEQIEELDADLVVIACCGFSLNQVQADVSLALKSTQIRASLERQVRGVWAIDGSQFFNRPGPRLIDSLEIMAHVIDPARHAKPSVFEANSAWIEITNL